MDQLEIKDYLGMALVLTKLHFSEAGGDEDVEALKIEGKNESQRIKVVEIGWRAEARNTNPTF